MKCEKDSRIVCGCIECRYKDDIRPLTLDDVKDKLSLEEQQEIKQKYSNYRKIAEEALMNYYKQASEEWECLNNATFSCNRWVKNFKMIHDKSEPSPQSKDVYEQYFEDVMKEKEQAIKEVQPNQRKHGKIKVYSSALHPQLHHPLVTVAEMSVEKGYAPFDYLTNAQRPTIIQLLEATQRHIDKFRMGYDLNKEEKTEYHESTKNIPSHLACAAYNLLMIEMQIRLGVQVDDRVFRNGEIIERGDEDEN